MHKIRGEYSFSVSSSFFRSSRNKYYLLFGNKISYNNLIEYYCNDTFNNIQIRGNFRIKFDTNIDLDKKIVYFDNIISYLHDIPTFNNFYYWYYIFFNIVIVYIFI